MSTQNEKLYSSTGELDPHFGENGLVPMPSPTPDYPEFVSRVTAIGPDNMIYIAGHASQGLLAPSVYTLTRLNDNGSIDTSFGKEGHFYDYFYQSDRSSFHAEQIIFKNDRIILTGSLFYRENGFFIHDKAAVRFLSNGTLDEEFGEKGKYIFHFPDTDIAASAYNEECLKNARSKYAAPPHSNQFKPYSREASLVQGDNIILLHTTGTPERTDSLIIRLTEDGALDTTFNGSGFVRVSHDQFPFLKLYSVSVDDTGNYISAGSVRADHNEQPDSIILVKHGKDGSLDTSFQQEGFLQIHDEDPNYGLRLIKTVKQPNNRILCLGFRFSKVFGELSGFLISREADGASNIQFNSGKPVFTNVNSSTTFCINVDFLPGGNFLTTALVDIVSRERHYAVARFLHNGAIDEDYGNGAGWLVYREAKNFTIEASTIKNNKIIFAVNDEHDNIIHHAIARGLMP
ncbi:hypothetical protein [Pseudomonas silesiensis]|uniref:hypothetical protein n=1 Tax=Pseudomonas silesiensis TaxID=1853130 RepID=UPI0034D62A92